MPEQSRGGKPGKSPRPSSGHFTPIEVSWVERRLLGSSLWAVPVDASCAAHACSTPAPCQQESTYLHDHAWAWRLSQLEPPASQLEPPNLQMSRLLLPPDGLGVRAHSPVHTVPLRAEAARYETAGEHQLLAAVRATARCRHAFSCCLLASCMVCDVVATAPREGYA